MDTDQDQQDVDPDLDPNCHSDQKILRKYSADDNGSIKKLHIVVRVRVNVQYTFKVKKAKIRNRYNQVAHLTWDTIQKSDKCTRKNRTQESQYVITRLQGTDKTSQQRQT